MKQRFIIWRDQNKERIRAVLMFTSALLLVLEVISLQGFIKDISSPEFSLDKTIPDEFKNPGIDTTIENLNNVYVTGDPEIIEIPYNPISQALWALLNISFYLFIISLLWRSQE